MKQERGPTEWWLEQWSILRAENENERLNLSCTQLHMGDSYLSAALCPKLGRTTNVASQIAIPMRQGILNTGNSAHQILGFF